jgi:hypothetical protein
MLGEKHSPAKSNPRLVDFTLLPHRIPRHVSDALATPTWAEGEEQDRRRLFKRLRYEIAPSLILRRWCAEEFCDVMPGYTLPRRPSFRYCMAAPQDYYHPHNALWEEITTRGRREELPPSRYEPMVLKAFKFAEERLSEGLIPDIDQREYGDALIRRWVRGAERGLVAFTREEAGVLSYIADQMTARGYVDVTCPAREVARAVGVDRMAAWRALKRLTRAGVLTCRSSGDAKRRLAAVYCFCPLLPGGPGGPSTHGNEPEFSLLRG